MDVRIIGVGNVLMGDEGWGPYVVKMLAATYDLPADVTLVDAGTPGLDIVPCLADADAAILIGAIRSSDPPGTVKICDKGALMTPVPHAGVAPRDSAVSQTLTSLDRSGHAPRDVRLIGLVPQWIATCPHLSDEARRAVPVAVEQVAKQLEQLGLRPQRKPSPHVPSIWWEESAAHV